MRVSIFILTFLFSIQFLNAQVYIRISTLAENTPEDADIYFAGNINGWNPGDPNYKLSPKEEGVLGIDLEEGSGKVEFKFTRGSWESVESNGNGGFRPNRSFIYGNGDSLYLEILGWEDLDGNSGSNTTANEQVEIWKEAMYMPQLQRSRRIWVYLPKDYHENNRRYPVLYMQDGQNVFDAYTSFFGEWKVDETLTEMEEEGYPGIIVVAIDNGGSHRIDEYSPFLHPQYGGGEGDQYLDFIIEDLKVAIDSAFRTRKDPKYTGIMGSSMGGLITHYAHFRNPEIFGRAGIFSPSYWFSEEYFQHTQQVGKTDSARLYLLAGALESTIAEATEEMYDFLIQMGYSDQELRKKISSDGEHSEWFWAREFREAIEWLFPGEEIASLTQFEKANIKIYPNPAKDTIHVECDGKMEVQLLTFEGQFIKKSIIDHEGTISISEIAGKKLIVVISGQDGLVYRKLLKF